MAAAVSESDGTEPEASWRTAGAAVVVAGSCGGGEVLMDMREM